MRVWAARRGGRRWTCGNAVGTPREVARFFWELLVAKSVVPPALLKEMERTVPLDKGWARGAIKYGAGLMVQQTAPRGPYPPSLDDYGAYLGHGGDTYGFLSEQGYVPQLNATFAVIANEDYQGSFVKNVLACNFIEMAADELLGKKLELGCGRV